MSDFNDIAEASAEQAAFKALAPLALELGITDLQGISSMNDLFQAWKNNTRDVPIMSLLNMGVQAGSMALNHEWADALVEFGYDKLERLQEELFKGLRIFADEMANDPELSRAIANLDIMQDTIFPIVDLVSTIYTEYTRLMGIVEPFMPYIELLVRALGIWINPAEATAFSQEATKQALKELSKIVRLLYADLKKYIINDADPIKVPEVLMGLSDGILDPSYSMDSLIDEVATNEFGIPELDDNYNFIDAEGNFDMLAVSTALQGPGDNPNKTIAGITALINNSKSYRELYTPFGDISLTGAFSWFNDYQNNLRDFQKDDVDYSKVKSPLRLIDIQRLSQDILDLLKDKGLQSYTTGTMLKMGCDLLAQDGAIVDYGTLHYDEKLTEKGGESFRKKFYDINNQINAYHDVISVLRGETRFNVTEKIPVVDFFEDYFSLQEEYTDAEHTEVSELVTENLDLVNLYDKTKKEFHSSIINVALKRGTSFEEIFYHPDYLNLTVDSTGSHGSPFLAGRFGEYPERDNNDKITGWNLVDERAIAVADNSTADISEGTYYNSAFLDDSGFYVPRPLTAATPATYRGYATELRTEILTSISNFKTTNTYIKDWATEDVLRISEASYKAEPGVNRLEILGDMSTAHAAWTSHISADTFTVSNLNSNDFALTKTVSSGRRRINEAISRRITAVFNSLYSTSLVEYREGTLDHFAASISIRANSVDYLKYLSIMSPYDILLEKYKDSPFNVSVDKDHMFLYSGTEFKRLQVTERVKREYSGKIRRWWRKLVRKKSYRWITKTYEVGEVQANNPTFFLVTKNEINTLAVGESVFFYGKRSLSRLFWRIKNISSQTNKVIGFKVKSKLEFAMPTNIKVDMGDNIMDYTEAYEYVAGTPCWVYELENLTLDVGFNYDPFCYPYKNFITTTSDGQNNFKWNSIRDLKSFAGKRGLPDEVSGHYKSSVTPKSKITVKALDPMLGTTSIGAYIRNHILARPLITDVEGGNTVVTLGESIYIFKTLSKYANLIKNLPVSGSEVILKYKERWSEYVKLLEDVLGLDSFTPDDVTALDNLFGDKLEDNVTVVDPWIEITDTGNPLFVPDDLFAEISRYMTEQLEGTGDGEILSRLADGPLHGRKDGLYYRRYLILNQRMNKQSGPLYHSTTLEGSNQIINSSYNNSEDQLEIIRYELDAIPVYNMQRLVFINNKFIDNVKYDIVRKSVGDKCLLTCGTCHIKYACPFYDEREIILTLLNSERTFSVYMKDNKLDLASSIKIDDEEKHSLYKTYHYPYSEIDDGNVRIIDDLLEDIDEIDPNFLVDGVPLDNMGWINKGRYGTVDIEGKSTRSYESDKSACSIRSKDLYTPDNKYLYDTLFFEDTETMFEYSDGRIFKPSDNTAVKIREANKIKAFSSNDLIFLVSNDGYDPIYLGKLFELELEIQNPQLSKAYAQAYVNLSDYENPNQVWSPSYVYKGKVQKGRLRRRTKTELIGDGSYTIESIIAGKPNMRSYTEFLREVKIPLDNVRWALSGKKEDQLAAKKTLPFFKTDVRLVNVQN